MKAQPPVCCLICAQRANLVTAVFWQMGQVKGGLLLVCTSPLSPLTWKDMYTVHYHFIIHSTERSWQDVCCIICHSAELDAACCWLTFHFWTAQYANTIHRNALEEWIHEHYFRRTCRFDISHLPVIHHGYLQTAGWLSVRLKMICMANVVSAVTYFQVS